MQPSIEGRRIYLVTRTRSQTVNVCTAANMRGHYQSVYRLSPPQLGLADVNGKFATLADLDLFLKGLHAIDEGPREPSTGASRLPQGVSPAADTAPAEALDDIWLEHATQTARASIDALIWDFAVHPYMHRRESSWHARLFSILVANPIFSHLIAVGGSDFFTQPVHREWPRNQGEDEDSIRGRFDLSIFSASQMADATTDLFDEGRIVPAIAIEMGMDPSDPVTHLTTDHDHLAASGVTEGFLVHLSRKTGRNLEVEEYLSDSSRQIQTAYAHHANGVCTFKTLNGDLQQVRTR